MLAGLAGVVVAAPFYWLLVPARFRVDVLAAASLVALAWIDVRLVVLVVALTIALVGMQRALRGMERGRGVLLGLSLVGLVLLFVWNKAGGAGVGPLPSQGGIVLLGTSYLVLKAAAFLLDTSRDAVAPTGFRQLLGWLAFLPTYPAGPIEDLAHFQGQAPAFQRTSVLVGLERILFGLVKSLLVAQTLGQWVDPIVALPASHGRGTLLLALYGASFRFYFDFAGYSDVAIGVAALYGIRIAENFDHPFLRRNLVQLWQHWHMTLTTWLRTYLFVPVTRFCIRRGGRAGDAAAPVVGQLVTMAFCGVWHGLGWNFVLWGVLHGVGLLSVGLVGRPLGRRLPLALLQWWRRSTIAYGLSTAATFTVFSLLLVFVLTDASSAWRYLTRIIG